MDAELAGTNAYPIFALVVLSYSQAADVFRLRIGWEGERLVSDNDYVYM